MAVLFQVSQEVNSGSYLVQLEGGAAEEEGISSSGSLERLRPLRGAPPLFAADMLGRSGELEAVKW